MILGIDPGERRYGVAIAHPETGIATPLEVIDVQSADPIERIRELIDALRITAIVVGVPVGLSGRRGPAAHAGQQFAVELRSATDVPVEEFDERFTTVVAERALRSSGARPKARKGAVDAVAAQVMLQGYLDATSRR
jgi:putative Holliday junction resolvase